MSVLAGEFHFLRPAWLLGLALLPLIHLAWVRLHAAREPWARTVDPHLLAALRVDGAHAAGPWPRRLALTAAAIALVALAGPAWQRLPEPLLRAESALVVAIDLSERMAAADLAPNRIARLKFKVADLLAARMDGQTALLAFAGDAFTVAPLTDDAATLSALLAALDTDTLPEPGQRVDRAIRRAQRLLADAGFAGGDLLVATDRAGAADIAAARTARAAGLRISVLGVGTPAGAPIPERGGGFREDAGQLAMAVRDDASLRALAEAGGGRYAPLSATGEDLALLALGDAAGAAGARLREDERRQAQYRDEGVWLLLLLLPLAALGFRRGWLACLLPLVLLAPAEPARALDLEHWFKRAEQRAWQALAEGDASKARSLAETPALRGAAAFREGDFAAAAADFAADDSASGHYNRGNALARAGDLEAALAAYDEALRRNPAMEDATANRAIVEEALRQTPPASAESPSGQQGEGEPPPSERQPQASEQSGGQEAEQPGQRQDGSDAPDEARQGGADGDQQPQSSGDEPADAAAPPTNRDAEAFSEQMQRALAEQGDAQADAAEGQPAPSAEAIEAEERAQSVEQWLRRVPDDPGGLLRRKFALEQRRRQAEGSGDGDAD